MKTFTRGQIAKQLGISTEAIRFYEQQGLVTPQRDENRYRRYDQNCVEKMKFILHSKDVGLSLQDIKELLSIQIEADQHTCQEVKNIIQAKIAQIEQRIVQLQHMQQALTVISDRCSGGNKSAQNCNILTALSETQSKQS